MPRNALSDPALPLIAGGAQADRSSGSTRRAAGRERPMRGDIAFNTEGRALRGRFQPPAAQGGPAPAVVMAHGFAAVKHRYLDRHADVVRAARLVTP